MAGQADPIDRGRETLLRALREGDVRFVVIGGAALQSHGQRYETEDIDVTPDRAEQNLARLADVLNRLECSLEVDPAHPEKAVSLPPDYFTASVLAQATVWNLRTAHGKLDLTLAPSGFPEGYTQLIADAEQRLVAATTITVAVASLADVEHSKRTADRAKDRAYLQQVGRLGPPSRRPRRRRAHRRLRTTCCEPTRAVRSCVPHVPRSPIHRRRDATAHALSHTTSASRRSRRRSRRLSRATAVRSLRSSAPNSNIPTSDSAPIDSNRRALGGTWAVSRRFGNFRGKAV